MIVETIAVYLGHLMFKMIHSPLSTMGVARICEVVKLCLFSSDFLMYSLKSIGIYLVVGIRIDFRSKNYGKGHFRRIFENGDKNGKMGTFGDKRILF